jgi:hypothetical protein
MAMSFRPHGTQDQKTEYSEDRRMHELVHVRKRWRDIRAGLTRQDENNTGPGKGQH